MSDPTPTVVLQKGAVSGDSQAAAVNTTLPTPLTVVVLSDGAPAAGFVVHFTPSGGGGIATPSFDTTGVDGVASTQWKLGTGTGVRTMTVSGTGVGGAPIVFRATALAGPATTLALISGNGQAQEVGLQFPLALIVKVTDTFGNAVSGTDVAWSVTSGNGTPSASNSATLGNGQTSVNLLAGGTPGPLQVQAGSGSLSGSPISFDLTVTPAASVITISNNAFTPQHDTISAGGAVRWVWNAGTHNVTFNAGPEAFANSGDKTAPSNYGPVLLASPGTYQYECTIHPGMTGTITVQ